VIEDFWKVINFYEQREKKPFPLCSCGHFANSDGVHEFSDSYNMHDSECDLMLLWDDYCDEL